MRTVRAFVAVLVLFGATTFAPPVEALPTYSIYREFWSCDELFLGWRYQSCGGSLFGQGAGSGYYMYRQEDECDGSESRSQWYVCTGGSCTEISAPPYPPIC